MAGEARMRGEPLTVSIVRISVQQNILAIP